QHDCEINLRQAEYLTAAQKDETLARYGEVTRELTAVTKRLTELERNPQVRATLEREEHAKNTHAHAFSSRAGSNQSGQEASQEDPNEPASDPRPWPEPEPLRREIPPGDP